MRPKCGLDKVVVRAVVMEVREVTSRGRMRIFWEEEFDDGSKMEERWDGFRAVATRRWVGCAAMRWARARPRPEEQPVMKKTASEGRV